MNIEEIRDEIKAVAPDAIAHICKIDGEESVEWICERARLGFVLDNENTSSWFMVVVGSVSKSDYIRDGGIELVRSLVKEFAATQQPSTSKC